MSRRKRRNENVRVRERRLSKLAVANVLRLEPIIRIHDRRDSYQQRSLANTKRRQIALRKEFDRINAPRRYIRRARHEMLFNMLGGETYHKIHNCRQEWRKLLSWRSGLGSGRKRSTTELRNSKTSFIKKDC